MVDRGQPGPPLCGGRSGDGSTGQRCGCGTPRTARNTHRVTAVAPGAPLASAPRGAGGSNAHHTVSHRVGLAVCGHMWRRHGPGMDARTHSF